MNQDPGAPPTPKTKKGLPVLGWVGIGCGTILIIVILAISLMVGWCKRSIGNWEDFKSNPEKATAKMVLRLTPDLELVSEDEAKGEMTIRTKDGKTITMSYKDIAEGKFHMVDADGNKTEIGGSDLSSLPSWVPQIPEMLSVFSSMKSEKDGKIFGFYSGSTSQTAAQLESHFRSEMEKLNADGTTTNSSTITIGEGKTIAFESDGRKITVTITSKPGGESIVNVAFEGPP